MASDVKSQQILNAEGQVREVLVANPTLARSISNLGPAMPGTSSGFMRGEKTWDKKMPGANANLEVLLTSTLLNTLLNIKEQFFMITDGDFSSLVTRMATEVTRGLGGQGDNHHERRMSIETAEASLSTETAQVKQLKEKVLPALSAMGTVTGVLDASTVLYKPARGVVFGSNKLAYYLTLGVIFTAAAAEVMTAIWLARSGGTAVRRRLSIGRAALCASIVPFVAIMAIGGFAFIEG